MTARQSRARISDLGKGPLNPKTKKKKRKIWAGPSGSANSEGADEHRPSRADIGLPSVLFYTLKSGKQNGSNFSVRIVRGRKAGETGLGAS